MSMLDDISAYLVSNSIGTAGQADSGGWSIHIGKLPAGNDQVIGLFQNGGSPADRLFDGVGNRHPMLQVRVRATQGGFSTGETKAAAIVTLLHAVHNQTLTSTKYLQIRSMSEIYLGTDDQGRPGWSLNFAVEKEP